MITDHFRLVEMPDGLDQREQRGEEMEVESEGEGEVEWREEEGNRNRRLIWETTTATHTYTLPKNFVFFLLFTTIRIIKRIPPSSEALQRTLDLIFINLQ